MPPTLGPVPQAPVPLHGSIQAEAPPQVSIFDSSHVPGPDEFQSGQCHTVIFDLGDVLFTWAPGHKTAISPALFHGMLRSMSWYEYEKGNLGEQEAYEQLAQEFSVPASDIAAAFVDARESLTSNPHLLQFIRELKAEHNVTIFGMSNITAPDWEVLRRKARPEDWALFEKVFISSEAHERKPNPGYYRHVLEKTGLDPNRTVFVDDLVENILTARSLGLKGVIFDSTENVIRKVRNLVTNPSSRAERWLRQNARTSTSVLSNGAPVHENFAPLLICEITGNHDIAEFSDRNGHFNFFKDSGDGKFSPTNFPDDLDTTSIGLSVDSRIDNERVQSVMDEMLQYRTADGIVGTYFDHRRPRIDPVVCTNILNLFYKNGRGHELKETEDWVYSVLLHRAYLQGTLYYCSADGFLFFLSRLVATAPTIRDRFEQLLRERLRERIGVDSDPLSLAMRITALETVGVQEEVDSLRLMELQEPDGSWPVCWVYRYPGQGLKVGNKALTTAFAAHAMKTVSQ